MDLFWNQGHITVLFCSSLPSSLLIYRDYTKGRFVASAKSNFELHEFKQNLINCLEGAAVSTRCTCKITDTAHYKGCPDIFLYSNFRFESQRSVGPGV